MRVYTKNNDNFFDISETVKELVRQVSLKEVPNDYPLYTTNLIDSIGLIDLSISLEDKFNIPIDVSDITEKNFNSIQRISEYIFHRLNEKT